MITSPRREISWQYNRLGLLSVDGVHDIIVWGEFYLRVLNVWFCHIVPWREV